MGKKTVYGVMGGTFDPIHYGHLVAAEAARDQFQLNKVIFVPSGRPPHKEPSSISEPRHRYLMTVLAVASNPFFVASRLEIDRPGLSYTVDTVKEFNSKFHPQKLYFITGADAILEIINWKNIFEILSQCYLIAATRPGYNLAHISSKLFCFPKELRERIFFFEVPALAISSTDIRRRVAERRTIKYLLPESVEQYIIKNKLYCAVKKNITAERAGSKR